MAAGLGFKDFTTGEVLTAADVDGYLMQGVWVFASAAARDAAVTSPQEGNFAYLKDTNVTTYYTGSAWANLDTTGMTNPMTTTGDTIYSSSGSTPARLGIGSTGQVLTVSGGVPTWATSSANSYTSLASGSLSGATTTVNITTTGYKQLKVFVKNVTAAADYEFNFRLNGDTGNNYNFVGGYMTASTTLSNQARSATDAFFGEGTYEGTANGNFCFTVEDPANTDAHKIVTGIYTGKNAANTFNDSGFSFGKYMSTSAISSVVFGMVQSASTGTYEIYGVK
jgi:hypothetical protein